MRLGLRGVWSSGWTVCKVFGAFSLTWLLLSIVFPQHVSNWAWAWILVACSAIAGFWGSRKEGTFLEALLGVVLSVFLVTLFALAVAAPLQPIVTASELVPGLAYVSVSCAAAAAIGYYLGRFILARRHRQGS
jgi:hypothetical protein